MRVAMRTQRRAVTWITMALVSSLCFWEVSGVRNSPLETTTGEGKEVVKDFQQCDRDCRWTYGFYDESIVGTRVDRDGNEDEWFGEHCKCTRGGQAIGFLVERGMKKYFDENFWCGNFSTSNVCAMVLSSGEWRTTTRQAAEESDSGLHILHCGACGACSSPDDMMVLYNTKTFITSKMTKCSIKFSMPAVLGGTHDLEALRKCLYEENITLNDTNSFNPNPLAGPGPSCMDCWTDDIQCDAVHCKLQCIRKFFDPNNNGKFEECLKCDENTCGPGFIKCAGANRRSTGIVSDIERVSSQVCPVGHFTQCSKCMLGCVKGDDACVDKCKALPSCKNPKKLVRKSAFAKL